MSRKTYKIFSGKAVIHMLCLPKIENASQEDRDSGLYQWAKVFKATTWKELIDLSKDDAVMEDTVVTIAQLSEDERIRQQCQRYEKYERDRLNAMNYSFEQGKKDGRAQLSLLCRKLQEHDRGDEIFRALNDSEYLEMLLKEFGLEE